MPTSLSTVRVAPTIVFSIFNHVQNFASLFFIFFKLSTHSVQGYKCVPIPIKFKYKPILVPTLSIPSVFSYKLLIFSIFRQTIFYDTDIQGQNFCQYKIVAHLLSVSFCIYLDCYYYVYYTAFMLQIQQTPNNIFYINKYRGVRIRYLGYSGYRYWQQILSSSRYHRCNYARFSGKYRQQTYFLNLYANCLKQEITLLIYFNFNKFYRKYNSYQLLQSHITYTCRYIRGQQTFWKLCILKQKQNVTGLNKKCYRQITFRLST
eukprot:TRINITY_DN2128_c0_g1_i4.p2 TRINITY_DN2128_c0_g1~~TRINITY_DN2128_c0_g1_i4.p2  ORF type:complete len:262 (-),score=-29.83 TRINITY_DN2128_c0_g1_i4:942-1727(-)